MADDYSGDINTTGHLTTGGSITGTLEKPGDVDWFRIMPGPDANSGFYGIALLGAANGAGTIDGRTVANGYSLSVYSDTGAPFPVHAELATSNGNLPALAFSPYGSRDFYVAVRSEATTATGTYTLTATALPADDYSEQSPTPIPVGKTLDGTIGFVNDHDVFSLTMDPGLLYQVVVKPLSGTVELNPDWYHGFNPPLGSTSDPLVLSGTGTQGTIAVTSHAGPATYSISFQQLPDDYASTVTAAKAIGALALNTPATGRIDAPNDRDWFAIDLQANQGYQFNVSGNATSLRIIEGNGDSYNPVSVNGTFFTKDYGSRYYVEVGGTQVGSYTLSATPLVEDYGNDKDHATVLRVGTSLNGKADGQGDLDVFAVPVTKGQKVAIAVTNTSGELPSLDSTVHFHIRNVNGTPLMQPGYGKSNFVTFTADADGTAYVGVSDLAGIGNYTVRALDVGADHTAPVLLNAQDATIAHDAPLRLRFSEAFGMAGNINTDDWSPLTLSLKDEQGHLAGQYGSSSGELQWDGNDLSIVPNLAWTPGATYTVTFQGGSFIDFAGNAVTPPDLRFHVDPLVKGTAGNDSIDADSRGARIDGGAGIDTVWYWGPSSNRTIHVQADGSATVGAAAGQPDLLAGVERLRFYGQQDGIALDIAGNGGQAYRLYQAAFARTPDKEGLGFWIDALDHGHKLLEVADAFITSPEFQGLYGAHPTDAQFVDLLYQNVLHRLPDDKGRAFWIDGLHNGATRADILVNFSESPENQGNVIKIIGDGFAYTPFGESHGVIVPTGA